MKKTTLSRRSVLRGLGPGLLTLSLPTLDIMLDDSGTAYADGGALPTRFGVWLWANGVQPSRWFPSGTGTGFALSEQLMPFANVKDYLSVVSGYDVKTSGQVHHTGTAAMMSAAPYKLIRAEGSVTTFSSPSVDVLAAQAIGTTALRSIEIGVDKSEYSDEGTTGYVLSHNGPDNVNPPIYSPAVLFDRLFSGAVGTMNPAGQRAAELALLGRRSVLDAVIADAKALQAKLGAADRGRLEQHLEGIRALEQRLSAAPPMGSTCTVPARPADIEAKNANHGVVTRSMVDMLALALACDVTRVFSVRFAMWHTGVFSELGATNDFHTYTHEEPGDQPMVGKHVVFAMEQIAYLLQKLKDTTFGASNLLEQSGILATSDVQEGLTHELRNMPILVAGRAGGKLRPGTHVKGNGDNTSDVLLTVLKAVGVPVTEIGDGAGRTSQTVSGLEV